MPSSVESSIPSGSQSLQFSSSPSSAHHSHDTHRINISTARSIITPPPSINNATIRRGVLDYCGWSDVMSTYFGRAHNYAKELRVKKEKIQELEDTYKVQFRAHKALKELALFIKQDIACSNKVLNVKAAYCIESIPQIKDDPRADYVRSCLIEEISRAYDQETLIKNLLMVRPTKTIFSFIEDCLPEERRTVFKEYVSQPKFLSSLLALTLPIDTRKIDREYGFKPENLEAVRKAWPCHGDFFIATSCLARLYFLDRQEELDDLVSQGEIKEIDHRERFITVSAKRFGINANTPDTDDATLAPYDPDMFLDEIFLGKEKFLAPLLKLKTEAVVSAIHNLKEWSEEIYSPTWANLKECSEYLFLELLRMPFSVDERSADQPNSLGLKKDLQQLLEILRGLKASMGIEDFFVYFFNLNSDRVIFDVECHLDNSTSDIFDTFLVDSMKKDFDTQTYDRLKALHEQWPQSVNDVGTTQTHWNEINWEDYIKGISFEDPVLQRKWISYCCFFYIVGSITIEDWHNNIVRKFEKYPELRYYQTMGDNAYWENLVTHEPRFYQIALDIMRHSCGGIKDKDPFAPGIPEALLK